VTIASLVVKLSANVAEFHRQMEGVARRVERTGRAISRAGHEISLAISLPIIAAGFAGFHALLQESTQHFGLLFAAFQSLKGEIHNLFLSVGHELQPIFLQFIDLLRGGVGILQGWINAFHQLPPGIQKAVIYTLAFLAALGPTVLVIGKVIAAIGAMGKVLGLLLTPTGLIVAAIIALAAAALYVVTHWEWAKLRFALAWAFIKDLFFDGVRVSILALDILTMGMLKVVGVTDFMRAKLNELADRSLAKSAAQILALQKALDDAGTGGRKFTNQAITLTQVLQDLSAANRLAVRTSQVMGPTFNLAAAQAQNFQRAIQEALSKGVDPLAAGMQNLGRSYLQSSEDARSFAEAIGAFGPRLEQQLRAAERFTQLITSGIAPGQAAAMIAREGQLMIDASNAIRDGVGGAFMALGEQLGSIFAGLAHGFRGFGKAIAGVLGATLKTVGQALIAFGVAGDAIKKFITNPFAAIAAGVALIALGSALAASAASSVSAGGASVAGGGGGAGASYDATSSAGGSAGGDVYVTFPGGQVFNPNDVQQQEAFREFLESLISRRVIILPAASA
jgi:uncharacterized protein YoaH (UPF0181 family)